MRSGRGVTAQFDASMRPPDLPGGNSGAIRGVQISVTDASMRPPDLPGGNLALRRRAIAGSRSFNEAAGFTRRKHA